MKIDEVLHRRGDLSTFVVHLSKDDDGTTAKDRLLSILKSRTLKAGSPMGWAKDKVAGDKAASDSQRVVCFSETPLEHTYSMFADIEGRQVRLAPYGLAFTKMVARRLGANPVWYVDMTPERDWRIASALDSLREEALKTTFAVHPAAAIFPFCEPMGTWPASRREFWWEREWRHVGDLAFELNQVALWLAPEDEHEELNAALVEEWKSRKESLGAFWGEYHLSGTPTRFIDPVWGLERIIGHLAGLEPGELTPFDTR